MHHKLLLGITLFLLLNSLLWSSQTFAAYTSTYAEPTITLKRGTYGTGVKWLQDMLNHNGYSIAVDGEYGNTTYQTVVKFQKKYELGVDGIVGSITRNALKKYANSFQEIKTMFTTTNVNLRSGPSTSYTSYQVLPTNTAVIAISTVSSWTYVQYNNTYGYIASQYLSISPTIVTPIPSNGLPLFQRNSTNLLRIIQNCKQYYASHPFYYSTANGVRSIPADKSTAYDGKYCVDCSAFVTWALYEYASANNLQSMKTYFSYQRNSATFASIGANGGNGYLAVVDKKTFSHSVNLALAKPGDILVSTGHVEFFHSYTQYSPTYVNIKVYNCGSNTSIQNSGLTTSATLNPNNISYILRVNAF